MLEWATVINTNTTQKSDIVSLFTGTYTEPGDDYQSVRCRNWTIFSAATMPVPSFLQGYAPWRYAG